MTRSRIETRYPNSALIVVILPGVVDQRDFFIMTMWSQVKGNIAGAAEPKQLQIEINGVKNKEKYSFRNTTTLLPS